MKHIRSWLIHVIQYIGERYKLKFIPDKIYLKFLYKHKTGHSLNIERPISFTEKIQWLKLYDKKSIYAIMADKYAVKTYSKEILSIDISIPTIGVFEKFNDISFDKLPDSFVIKCTHDWNSVVICKNKKEMNINDVRTKINKALKRNHYYHSLEWAYKNIAPRIIIEPFLSEDGINPPIDYRVYCFNGQPYFIHLTLNKFSNREVLFYDIKWNKIHLRRNGLRLSPINIARPKTLDRMIYIASRLSQEIPFLRVDFYIIKNRLFLGECTFYPGEGFSEFYPPEENLRIGELINIKEIV